MGDEMTFSYFVKTEILENYFRSYKQAISELMGVIYGTKYTCGNNYITIRIDNPILFNYLDNMINIIDGSDPSVNEDNIKSSTYTFKNYYVCKLMFYVEDKEFKHRINLIFENKIIDRSYFIRGLFLMCGSIINPNNSYHLEFSLNSYDLSYFLDLVLNFFGIKSKMIKRKDKFIRYVKEAESISQFLKVIGVHKSVLKFEDIRVLKEYTNNKNRLKNCIQANEDKSIIASVKQVRAIMYIEKYIGLDNLSSKLKEIAKVRLKYKEASLGELGKYLDPPIGKSGVLHRMKKIEKIASELEDKYGI